MGKLGLRQNVQRAIEHAQCQRGVAFFRDQFGGLVRRQLRGEEKIGGREHVAQQADALADERRDARHGGLVHRDARPAHHRQQFPGELLGRHGANGLGVEPHRFGIERVGFGEVHHRVAAVDAGQRERLDQVLARHLLAVVLGRPAQQAQEVHEGVRQKARVAISGHADHRAVAPLGKLGSVGRHQQRQVGEGGRLAPGRLEDQQVLKGVGEVVLAANDVADAQIGVIGAGGQVIGGHAVGAQQREILDIGGGLGLLAVHPVGEAHGALGIARHAEPQREGFARRGPAVALFGRHLAHLGVAQPGSLCARAGRLAGLRRREIAVGEPLAEDRVGHLPVQGQPLGLPVLLIPAQIEPAEPFENRLQRRFAVAFHVGIVDAQNHGAAVVAGIQPVKNVSARAPDVQEARGRRREADSGHG